MMITTVLARPVPFSNTYLFATFLCPFTIVLVPAATWTPSQTERTAPTTNFRVPPVEAVGGRAPWAAANNNDHTLAPTRAPWVDDDQAQGGGAMPPTRAPWAK